MIQARFKLLKATRSETMVKNDEGFLVPTEGIHVELQPLPEAPFSDVGSNPIVLTVVDPEAFNEFHNAVVGTIITATLTLQQGAVS